MAVGVASLDGSTAMLAHHLRETVIHDSMARKRRLEDISKRLLRKKPGGPPLQYLYTSRWPPAAVPVYQQGGWQAQAPPAPLSTPG